MDSLVGLLSGLGILLVALAGHEVGHLAAGRLCGYRFGLLAVGPVCLMRSQDRFRLRWLPASHWGPFAAVSGFDTERLEAIRARLANPEAV